MTWSFPAIPKFWPHAYGAACAVATVVLLTLPISTPGPTNPPKAETYLGAVHKLRTTATSSTPLPVRFTSAATTPIDIATPSALPTLIGVAGGTIWLKSAATGGVERVLQGGEMDGWKVIIVRARSVTLARNEERETLELYRPIAPPNAGPSISPGQNGPITPTPPPVAPRVLAPPAQDIG